MSYFATDFQNVDSAGTSQRFVTCLRLQQSLEFYRAYKRQTIELMGIGLGDSVLEVGCGTGEDAIALAGCVGDSGRVHAVDRSATLLAIAAECAKTGAFPIRFVHADARALPFSGACFDGARVDRTLQHIEDAQQVVSEMARVVRSGGRIVAMDPDWETLTVDSDHKALTRTLLNFWCDSFPSGGWIGRQLARHFKQAGLVDIEVHPQTLVMTDLELADQVLDLVQTACAAREAGLADPDEIVEWMDEMRDLDRHGQFFCSFTAFIVKGIKPALAVVAAETR